MIGQQSSLSFVKVEPTSPVSAAKANCGLYNVSFDHDYLSNQSYAFSYNHTSVPGNFSPSVRPSSTVSADTNPLVKADSSRTNLSDNVSCYSPVSMLSAAPADNDLPMEHGANSFDTRNPAIAAPQNTVPSAGCDHYEYPRYYFEALIDDAQIRYDKASEFFANMRTYSSKCEVYITILQDLFVELAKPPPTLKPELYKRLARLRRSIRHLELKMLSRRPRTTGTAALPARDSSSVSVIDLCEKPAVVPAAVNAATNLDVTSSVQEPDVIGNLQEYCLKQMKMKEILEQRIYDLAEKERELRQERHEAEAELNYLFGGNSSSVLGAASRPKYNCIFCGKHNQSHTCWNISTIEERRAFFQMYKICFSCAKQHYGDCNLAGIVTCAWPQCGAKGDHNSVFCPKVTYPITKGQIMALRASQNMPTTFVCPETTKREVPASNGLPPSYPSPVPSPLSQSLSASQPKSADPSKRPKKRVTVTVLKEPPTKKQCC